VTSTIGEPTTGRAGRPRKYYALTPTGARALSSTYSTIQAMADGLTSQLSRLAGDKG
jgi:DNA-binding PadR family transcriptional regulator